MGVVCTEVRMKYVVSEDLESDEYAVVDVVIEQNEISAIYVQYNPYRIPITSEIIRKIAEHSIKIASTKVNTALGK